MSKNHFIFIATIVLFISCRESKEEISIISEKTGINFSENSFSYIETEDFGDYFDESFAFIYDITEGQTLELDAPIGFGRYQWIESEVVYLQESEIIFYNPKSNESNVFSDLSDKIQSFHYHPSQKIAFSDYKDIYVYDITNGTSVSITKVLDGDFRFPKFSPDGRSILFIKEELKGKGGGPKTIATGRYIVYHFDSDSFQDVEMFDEFASPNNKPSWSPDGEVILYGQYQGIFTFNLTTNELTRITDERVIATNPSYSRDGKRMSYFSSDTSHNGNNWQSFLTIFHFETQSSEVVNNKHSYGASWNSESNKIIFCTDEGIHSFDIDKKELENLVESKKGIFMHSPIWVR